MGLNFLILEQEVKTINFLKKVIESINHENKILTADRAEVGLILFEKYSVDIVLVNTELKGTVSGWKFIERLREQYKYVPIILINSNNNLTEVLEGFKRYNLMDSLSKPLEVDYVEQAIRKSLGFLEKIDEEIILLKGHGVSKRYNARDIYCAERPKRPQNNRCVVITAYDRQKGEITETELPLRGSIMEIVDKFKHKKTLLRCHQSHLVNPRYIDRIDWRKNKIILTTGRELPIGGEKYKQELDPFVS